ncbi:hypothetical protein GCM10010404_81220 [Nonomuraea africana]|uniref:Uncharacterized protein n=1 Tax=Nonomuraea africana TaxID=46171 RepID=A0ABR9KWW9_9ACTN|nr:hypothetical protein [Nonomuraea africana]MBE1566500.1 hypothetical protein [Nonomuraea africana]
MNTSTNGGDWLRMRLQAQRFWLTFRLTCDPFRGDLKFDLREIERALAFGKSMRSNWRKP